MMTTVMIPQPMRVYTQDLAVVKAGGKNVRQLIDDLEARYPGIRSALLRDDKLKPGIAIMLDGKVSPLGLLEPVSEDNELAFIFAIGGG